MRHRKSGRKFGMDSSARKAMLRNMATSLFVHGQIRTTEARAKELRRYAERLITIGKRAPSKAQLESMSGAELATARAHRVAAIRRLKRVLMNDEAIQLVMGDYADQFRSRPGGYTRVIKLGRPRPGDNARMAVISLVAEPVVFKEKRAPVADAEEAQPTEEVAREITPDDATEAEPVADDATGE